MKRTLPFALLLLCTVACSVTPRLKLQKIRAGDPKYISGFTEMLRDTLLPDGTWLEYRVCDGTRYSDLYLLWGRDKHRDTICWRGLIGIGDTDYLPQYMEMKKGYHWFDMDCAAIECAGLMLLSTRGDGYSRQFMGVLDEFPEREAILYSGSLYGSEIKEIFCFHTDKRTQDTLRLPEAGYFYRAELRGDSLLTEFSSEAYGDGEISRYVFSVDGK
ncbi:MAG: hypothetical protein IBJ09_02675 [Bacteroidia bacterium]|nr:hypothetical protein [Bacteroidia bacterium]